MIITILKGATFNLAITWQDGSGNVYNLLGYTADLQIRDRPWGPILLELSTANGLITVAASSPNITLTISETTTATLAWDSGFYDLKLTAPDSTVSRIMEGQVVVSPDITQ